MTMVNINFTTNVVTTTILYIYIYYIIYILYIYIIYILYIYIYYIYKLKNIIYIYILKIYTLLLCMYSIILLQYIPMYLPHLLIWFVNFSDPCVFPCGVCPRQEPRRSRRSPVVHPDLQRRRLVCMPIR